MSISTAILAQEEMDTVLQQTDAPAGNQTVSPSLADATMALELPTNTLDPVLEPSSIADCI